MTGPGRRCSSASLLCSRRRSHVARATHRHGGQVQSRIHLARERADARHDVVRLVVHALHVLDLPRLHVHGLLGLGQVLHLRLGRLHVDRLQGVEHGGEVGRVGAELRQEGEESFVIAEARVPNEDGALKAGMLGTAKVSAGTRRLGTALLRKPLRYLWLKIWPLLP